MAQGDRFIGIRPKTWQVLRRIIRDYIAGRLTNRPPTADEPRRGRGNKTLIGKPVTSLAHGAVSAPDNEIEIWTGSWGSYTASGNTKVIHGSMAAFTSSDFVVIYRINGELIAGCLPGGSA